MTGLEHLSGFAHVDGHARTLARRIIVDPDLTEVEASALEVFVLETLNKIAFAAPRETCWNFVALLSLMRSSSQVPSRSRDLESAIFRVVHGESDSTSDGSACSLVAEFMAVDQFYWRSNFPPEGLRQVLQEAFCAPASKIHYSDQGVEVALDAVKIGTDAPFPAKFLLDEVRLMLHDLRKAQVHVYHGDAPRDAAKLRRALFSVRWSVIVLAT